MADGNLSNSNTSKTSPGITTELHFYLQRGKIAFEKRSKRSDYFVYMHLSERITEITTSSSEPMEHFFESTVTAVITKIDSEHLV